MDTVSAVWLWVLLAVVVVWVLLGWVGRHGRRSERERHGAAPSRKIPDRGEALDEDETLLVETPPREGAAAPRRRRGWC
jgi:hypothetical protein